MLTWISLGYLENYGRVFEMRRIRMRNKSAIFNMFKILILHNNNAEN